MGNPEALCCGDVLQNENLNPQHLYAGVLQIAEAAKTSSQTDDLYLDEAGSGGYYPEDDDDFNSGSGSGEA